MIKQKQQHRINKQLLNLETFVLSVFEWPNWMRWQKKKKRLQTLVISHYIFDSFNNSEWGSVYAIIDRAVKLSSWLYYMLYCTLASNQCALMFTFDCVQLFYFHAFNCIQFISFIMSAFSTIFWLSFTFYFNYFYTEINKSLIRKIHSQVIGKQTNYCRFEWWKYLFTHFIIPPFLRTVYGTVFVCQTVKRFHHITWNCRIRFLFVMK